MKERTIRYRKMFKARHKSLFLDGLPTDENRKGLPFKAKLHNSKEKTRAL